MQDWVFFSANLLFALFNAWLGWINWKRLNRADFPIVGATLIAEDLGDTTVDITVRNHGPVGWHGVSASLVRPHRGKLARPRDHMVTDPGSGEPWLPQVYQPNRASLGRDAGFTGSAAPVTGSFRETYRVYSDRAESFELRLIFESDEPKPRRYIAKVKRQVPALNTVTAT